MADLSYPHEGSLAVTDITANVDRRAYFALMSTPPPHISLIVAGCTLHFGHSDAAVLGRWLLAYCQPDVRVVCAECPRT